MFDAAPADAMDADELARRYIDELRAEIRGTTDIADAVVASIENDEIGDVTLEAAAQILAADADHLDADAINAEFLDGILIEMSNAVVDVDTLAAEIELDRSGKGLQQRIEGRAPMTLREYAAIRHAIAIRQN